MLTYYSELFQAFEEQKLRYLVVGGVAVVLHGFLRATADLDVMIALDSSNVQKFLALMKQLGYKPKVPVALDDFASPEKRGAWIVEKEMLVFSLVHPKHHTHLLDVFVNEPVPFDEAYERRVKIRTADGEVSVASIPDLILMKQKAGRSQDAEDIRALRNLSGGTLE